MGIKELWGILGPFFERKPLYELQGKTVAVDLSGWVCQSENVRENYQSRMYLRNLFFRTCYLLLMDVHPVFVLEGKAPLVKYQTIANRNEFQYKAGKQKATAAKDRTRFNYILKQCEEMLKYMGLNCIQGTGEAECMCAYLNEAGLVSGCISQDSDCFAYGAQVVYRNFSISHQGSYAAKGGSVDIYDIERCNKHLNFGRKKLVALALLCGSDYNEGIRGVGKDSALKLLNTFTDDEILPRLRSWKTNIAYFTELQNKVNDKNVCVNCGHKGNIQTHKKYGCVECESNIGCDCPAYKEELLSIKNELQIRAKALLNPNFPDEEIISEYLNEKDKVNNLDIEWKQPDVNKFVDFTKRLLQWEEIYSFEKFLPLLTRWMVKNYKPMLSISDSVFPNYIHKARRPKGVLSYEIVWEDKENCFEQLIPNEQITGYLEKNKYELQSLWSTVEPGHLVENTFPELLINFNAKKAKVPSKRQVSKNTDLPSSSTQEPKVKKKREKTQKTKQSEIKTINKIENYFKSTKKAKEIISKEHSFFIDISEDKSIDTQEEPKSSKEQYLNTFKPKNKLQSNIENSCSIDIIACKSRDTEQKQQTSKEQHCTFDLNTSQSKDKQNKEHESVEQNESSKIQDFSFNMNASNFGDEDEYNENDFSVIIEDIVKYKQPVHIRNYEDTKLDTEIESLNQSSSFFEADYQQVDLFETTFNKKYLLSDSDSNESETSVIIID